MNNNNNHVSKLSPEELAMRAAVLQLMLQRYGDDVGTWTDAIDICRSPGEKVPDDELAPLLLSMIVIPMADVEAATELRVITHADYLDPRWRRWRKVLRVRLRFVEDEELSLDDPRVIEADRFE
jgi:hypothetical protein